MKRKAKKHKTKGKDIYITDLSFEVDEEELKKLFSVCGTVRSVHLLTDSRSGLFNGRAFVCMSNDAETKDAINTLDGTRLIDRIIKVRETRPKGVADPDTAEVEPEVKERKRRPTKGRRR